jgi:hypothetical protein
VIVWLTFDEVDPETDPLKHDADLRRLGAGLSRLGGLLELALAGLGRGAHHRPGVGADGD